MNPNNPSPITNYPNPISLKQKKKARGMKGISLKKKITIIGFVPFFFYLLSAIYSISGNYGVYNKTETLKSQMQIIDAASEIVHETQKERGKSAGYLNGGVSLESLKKQREINDKAQIKLRALLPAAPFEQAYKDGILSELNKIPSLREKVAKKEIQLGKALQTYTKIIKTLLNIELDVAAASGIQEASAKLKDLRILEDAKESGGKLRANMTAVLAKNMPISDKKFTTLTTLKAGVDQGIASSALDLDENGKEYILKFKSSKEWEIVNATFRKILKESSKGDYNQEPAKFFATITAPLNILGELINYQKTQLTKKIGELQKEAIYRLTQTSIIACALMLFIFAFVSLMSNSIVRKIQRVITTLKSSSEVVNESSQCIATTSKRLGKLSTEQASSVEQTVTSIDEINNMVQRTADAAARSTATTSKSIEVVDQGQKHISEMIHSIDEISKSNQEIMKEIQNNNETFSQMTKLISQIGEKTTVINDIVFQTKLLSFNASVEAARAGVHGKGFAVVAEEIGSLASMSGKAAIEISDMLKSSIEEVNEIVDASKAKIETLIAQGKERVERGTNVAHECGDVLKSILDNVDTVNNLVKDISSASNKQALDVKDVSLAMQSIDSMTHANSSIAKNASKMAENLKLNTQGLNKSVIALTKLVNGEVIEEKKDAPIVRLRDTSQDLFQDSIFSEGKAS